MSSEEEKPYDLLADYLSSAGDRNNRYRTFKGNGQGNGNNNGTSEAKLLRSSKSRHRKPAKKPAFAYGTILDEIVVKIGRGSMPYTATHPAYALAKGVDWNPAKAVQHLLIQIAATRILTPFNRETMILVKGQSCHFNGQEHTIIETNYLGLRLSSDETGETVFIKASDADKVLLMIESEPKIKAVEVKLPPLSEHTRNGNYLRGAKVKDLQHGRGWFMRGQMAKQTPEQVKMREAARLAGAIASRKSPKQETPIEEIRERSKETSILDSSNARRIK